MVLSVVSTARHFAPEPVRTLSQRLPGIELTLRVGNRDPVIADLDEERRAPAIMGRPQRMAAVEAVPIGPHPHGIIAPPDHLLIGRGVFAPDDPRGNTLLIREAGSGTHILMERCFDRLDIADR